MCGKGEGESQLQDRCSQEGSSEEGTEDSHSGQGQVAGAGLGTGDGTWGVVQEGGASRINDVDL